ncbi:MAG TPA: RNA polymerase sigma factor [Roseiflexaceae bacterium]|nr:RNA polymerase sigma factor [Roseiflexaceae bacterium]
MISDDSDFEALLAGERGGLVRLCARISGDAEAAEDLAQEALVEAWRHRDRLVQPEGVRRWLAAIARNVCMRWRQRRGAERSRLLPLDTPPAADVPPLADQLAGDEAVDRELERDELATLLDRALALLPPDTRAALVARYVHESSQAAIADLLGVSAGAVEARLHRGRLALRRVLTSDLANEAAAWGLTDEAAIRWEITRIWCPRCGRQRLNGFFQRERGDLVLRCPDCCTAPDDAICSIHGDELLDGVRGFRPALNRVAAHSHAFYRAALDSGGAACGGCGGAAQLRYTLAPDLYPPETLAATRGVHLHCPHCAVVGSISLRMLVLCTPEAQRFWRAHERIRALPEREVVVADQPALLTRLEQVTGSAALEFVSASQTYQLLAVNS